MKKVILTICEESSSLVNPGTQNTVPNFCKLIIIDTESAEKDPEFPVITLRTDSCNRVDPEVIKDLLSSENQVYVLLSGYEKNHAIPGILHKNDEHIRPVHSPAGTYSLTRQERIVMKHLDEGLQYKQIADALNISFSTVKNHISNIYSKMNVKNMCEAVDRYRERGA
jgi:DNA-binding CsgD family transcriptional regulator